MMSRTAHPLLRLLQRRRLRICGINTGTSIDGLDLALTEIENAVPRPRIRLLGTDHRLFPDQLAGRLRQLAFETNVVKEEVARTHLALGVFIAAAVNSLSHRSTWRRHRKGRDAGSPIDLIASHGQTIGHWAGGPRSGRALRHATWQIGSLDAIARRTGIVTIGDFRSADVTARGMGAPLSGYYHHLLFGEEYAVLNVGGIANLSASRTRRGALQIQAFDVGPGNMFVDMLAQRLLNRPFDAGGRAAARGRAIDNIVRFALADPYYHRRPPKSCGREEFGEDAVNRLFYRGGRPRAAAAHLLATAVEIPARAVADAVMRWTARFTATRRLIISGGGARNAVLLQRLGDLLPEWVICSSDEWSIPVTHVEPVGFAVLAHETLRARPGNLGGATRAEPAILGLIALPDPD